MTRVSPFSAGDARDPRQRTLTNIALVCWGVPVFTLLAVAAYAAAGAPLSHLLPAAVPWPVLRVVGPTALFVAGTALGLVAVTRCVVRNRVAVVALLLNAVALVVTALIVAGPALAGVLGR